MLENYYNLYSSCAYGSRKRPWYVALRKTGRPRKGKNSRKRRKSSHFLVVHFGRHTSNNARYRYGNRQFDTGSSSSSNSGYTIARTNADGSIQLFESTVSTTKPDHSRFGAAARDRQWRTESSDWRRYVQTEGTLSHDNDYRTVINDNDADRRRMRLAPIADSIIRPSTTTDDVISLNEILASTLLRQQQQAMLIGGSASIAADSRRSSNNDQHAQIDAADRRQRRKRRRKDRRLQQETRRREKRRKQLERLRQEQQQQQQRSSS